jgi:sentrin-specific protease 1
MNITRGDLNTLVGSNWLNDEVINFYMNLLVERSEKRADDGYPKVYSMNTFFIPKLLQSGHPGLKRWTRKVDIFSYDVIPVPVHVGEVHWCMAIIHMRNKTIKYYDSMGKPNERVLDALEQYLKDECMDKKKEKFDMSGWEKVSVPDCPRQMNGSDCGVFSCMNAEFVTRDSNITFSQQHMPYFRHKMVCEIAGGAMWL